MKTDLGADVLGRAPHGLVGTADDELELGCHGRGVLKTILLVRGRLSEALGVEVEDLLGNGAVLLGLEPDLRPIFALGE